MADPALHPAEDGCIGNRFFRECDAAFKQGAKFARWTTGAQDDAYYHPLMLPQGFEQVNLAPHWLSGKVPGGATPRSNVSFCDAVCAQGIICDNGLAPKSITTPEYEGAANYAYHLDAGKFAPFLQRHCVEKLGVRHVLADVSGATRADNGDIAAIQTDRAGAIAGDLFVDCTGFRSLLLGQTMGWAFGTVPMCSSAIPRWRCRSLMRMRTHR
jgi:tryptophan halogenase